MIEPEDSQRFTWLTGLARRGTIAWHYRAWGMWLIALVPVAVALSDAFKPMEVFAIGVFCSISLNVILTTYFGKLVTRESLARCERDLETIRHIHITNTVRRAYRLGISISSEDLAFLHSGGEITFVRQVPPDFDEQMSRLGEELRAASQFIGEATEPDIDPHEVAVQSAIVSDRIPDVIDVLVPGVESSAIGEPVESPEWAEPKGKRSRRRPNYKAR